MSGRSVVRRVAAAAAMLAASVLTGCAAPPQRYAWGAYEDLIYASYSKPGALSPEQQIDQMQKDREAARAANAKLPPGWHAHLAYLYQLAGRPDLSHEELLAEKSAYPESTQFVDRLVTNMVGKPVSASAATPAPPPTASGGVP